MTLVPYDLSTRLHPAISIVRIDDERLGFLGIPDAVRIRDVGGLLYSKLSEPGSSVRPSELLSLASTNEDKNNLRQILDFLMSFNFLVHCDLEKAQIPNADRFAAQLDFICRNVQDHYAEFGISVGYRESANMKAIILGNGSVAEEFAVAISSLVPGSSRVSAIKDICFTNAQSVMLVGCYDSEHIVPMLELNRFALQNAITSFFVVASSYRARVGPIVVPNKPGCLVCFERRLSINSKAPGERSAFVNAPPSVVENAIPAKLAASIGASIVSKYLLGLRHLVKASEIIEYDLINDSVSHAALVADPRCPSCRAGFGAAVSVSRIGAHNEVIVDNV